MRKILAALTFCALAPLTAAAVCAPQLTAESLEFLRESDDIRPFTANGTYHTDYDIILNLPFYRQAMDLHLRWIRQVAGPLPRILEAGGGTGNMTAAALRERPEADIHLLDLNAAMVKFAAAKGVPAASIHIANITHMEMNGKPVPADSVDHIFSHSVIWGLPRPEDFFTEAARVLKAGGTLAISTVQPSDDVRVDGFIHYLEVHLDRAVRSGRITPAQRTNFVDNNRRIARVIKHPLTAADLKKMAGDAGFDMLESHPAYVVETARGPEAFFVQVLLRKREK